MRNITVSKSEKGNVLIKSEGFQFDDNKLLHLKTIDGKSIRFKPDYSHYKMDEICDELAYILSDEECENINKCLDEYRLNNIEFAICGTTMLYLKKYNEYRCRDCNVSVYKLYKGLSKYDFPKNSNDFVSYITENCKYQATSNPKDLGEYIVFRDTNQEEDIEDDDYDVNLKLLFGEVFKDTKVILNDDSHSFSLKKIECNQLTNEVLRKLPQLIPGCTFTLFYYDTIKKCTQTVSFSYRALFSFISNQLEDVISESNGIKDIEINI